MEVFEGIHQCLPTCNKYNAWLDTLDRLLHHSKCHWTDPPPHKKQKTKNKILRYHDFFFFHLTESLYLHLWFLTLNFTCKNVVPGVAVCFSTDISVCWCTHWLGVSWERDIMEMEALFMYNIWGLPEMKFQAGVSNDFFFLYLPLPINLNFE